VTWSALTFTCREAQLGPLRVVLGASRYQTASRYLPEVDIAINTEADLRKHAPATL
jgi:hypothetical protein